MNDPLEAIFQQIRELFAAEHLRVEKDISARVMQAVKGDAPNIQDIKKAPVHRHRLKLKNHRAPAGAADALIKRALGEYRMKGATPLEIQNIATTSAEKEVSYSGIRFALHRGRVDGTYKNKNGKWFLIEIKAAEHQRAAE